MRVSRQRRFILELLWDTQDHLTAREIYDRLKRQGKAIGHTSVYQNLDALTRQGIIECIDRADGRHYGNLTAPHSHVNCLDTGRITDIEITLSPEQIAQIERQTGLKITTYRIDFFGHPTPGSRTETA
ncbi:MAG: transcriptional repressor [Cyanobacteria bacterium]|nr:transcriptional repressor [Cyanobacteriota bacterium]